MEANIIKIIKTEIKALKELKELHPQDEKLIDSLIKDWEEKLKEVQEKEKIEL